MNARIAELKKLHVCSKPELALAIKNTEHHMETSNLQPKTTHTIQGLIMACKSYDEVIDELFAEIERLTCELAERDITIKRLEKRMEESHRQTVRAQVKREDAVEEADRLYKALEEAGSALVKLLNFPYLAPNEDTRFIQHSINDVIASISLALGAGDKR